MTLFSKVFSGRSVYVVLVLQYLIPETIRLDVYVLHSCIAPATTWFSVKLLISVFFVVASYLKSHKCLFEQQARQPIRNQKDMNLSNSISSIASLTIAFLTMCCSFSVTFKLLTLLTLAFNLNFKFLTMILIRFKA